MKTTRRNLFAVTGGAVAGALFTPAPWRLITDTALWSENWPGIPRPARGEIRTKETLCALCPAGCPVKARCVGDQPVAISGAQCAFGLTAHHLPYHPARLRQGPVEQAAAAWAKRTPEDLTAILDLNPGRAASRAYRRAAHFYITADPNPVSYDLSAVRTVLSLGVPLLESWGTPANVFAARANFHLIQVEAIESPTALLADEFIRIAPGGEAEFLANLPRRLRDDGTSLVLGDYPGVAELNQRLHAPVYPRPDSEPATSIDSIPDRSIRYLAIDESNPVHHIPWYQIERKLVRDNPVVIVFSATRGGYGRYATYTLPVAIYPEIAEDIPAAIDQIKSAERRTTPLIPPPPGMVNPVEFLSAADLQVRAVPIAKPAPSQPEPADLPLIAISAPSTPALLSPLMTKLYQESNLKLAPNAVALNPASGLAPNSRATLQTRLGRCAVQVTLDASVPPGAVLTGGSPGIRDICSHGSRAKVVRS